MLPKGDENNFIKAVFDTTIKSKGGIHTKAEQLKELLQDKEFVNKVKSVRTSEELIALFKEKDVEITKEELVALRNSNHVELTDEELENVSGGYSWDEFWDDVYDVLTVASVISELIP